MRGGARDEGQGRDPIGRYEVERELARGGMGVVYLAHDRELGRRVAIKVVLGEVNERELARFRREGEVLARLRHRHIVGIHEGGVDALGRPFLVLDYLEGSSLQGRLREGPLPWEEAADIGGKLADALAHAHDLGVQHRDLKPANVLVDGQGEPVLADFGLARDAQALQRLTQSGIVLGTPAYMPPEQAGGVDADRRSDVYGLGATLYALLSARAPFEAPSLPELLKRLATEAPVSLAERAPDCPPDLVAVVMRTLAKEPGDRYPDMRALAADLVRVRAGQPLGGARPPRRRWSLALAALLLGLLLGAAALAAGLALRGRQAPAADGGGAGLAEGPSPSAAGSRAGSEPDEADGRAGSAQDEWLRISQAARSLELQRDPYARSAELARLEAWLARHPAHPERAAAQALRRELRRDTPLAWCLLASPPGFDAYELRALPGEGETLLVGGAHAPGNRCASVVARWSARGGRPRARSLGLDLVSATTAGPGRLLLATAQGPFALDLALASAPPAPLPLAPGHPSRLQACVAAHPGGAAWAFTDEGRVLLLDSRAPAPVPVPHRAEAVAFAPEGDRLYVTSGLRLHERSGGPVRPEDRRRAGDGAGFLTCARWPEGRIEFQERIPFVGMSLLAARGGRVIVGLQIGMLGEYGPDGAELGGYVDPAASDGGLVARGHRKAVFALALSPDESRLYSCGEASLAEWDRRARTLRRRLEWPAPPPGAGPGPIAGTSLTITPDGERLLVGTRQGVVLVYAADP
ncbi:MAG: protein kinase [Planctomycetota bacterium]